MFRDIGQPGGARASDGERGAVGSLPRLPYRGPGASGARAPSAPWAAAQTERGAKVGIW